MGAIMSEDGGIEVVREGESPQVRPFARAAMRDARLTFGAKGLFGFLWGLPAGWRVRAVHLATVGPQGKDAVRSLLRELEKVGAVRIEGVRVQLGRLAGKRWILRAAELWAVEAPLSRRGKSPEPAPAKESTEGRETRLSEKPKIGKPGGGRPATKGLEVKVFSSTVSGMLIWTEEDGAAAAEIEIITDPTELAAAIAAIRASDQEPLPGRVRRELATRRRKREIAENAATKKAAEAEKRDTPRDPRAAAAGLVAAKSAVRRGHP